MTKLAEIEQVIEGAHVLGVDGLRDYHTARQVRDALRCNFPTRLMRVKQLLHPYRVTVAMAYDLPKIAISNNERGLSIEL